MPGEALYNKYRPREWKEVIGQKATVNSLRDVLDRGNAHSFIFSGPSGTGKTTLARITSRSVGCNDNDLVEIPAAKFTGIDDMRELQDTLQYRPFSSDAKSVILDEAHRLSKNAWDSLLKIVEEPPDFLYFFFCTTELNKIPAAIKTRSQSYALKLVPDQDIRRLVEWIAEEEGMKPLEAVVDIIVREAHGSPRQAICNLDACADAQNGKEAATILHTAQESDPTRELCQFLMKGGSWMRAMAIIEKLDGENPEGIRIVVCNYIASALKSSKTDEDAFRLCYILDAFSESYNASEGNAPLFLSMGKVLLNPE